MNESGVSGWRVRTWEVEALLRAPMPTCLRAMVDCRSCGRTNHISNFDDSLCTVFLLHGSDI